MHTEQPTARAEPREPQPDHLDDYAGYEDGDGYVVCEKTNAKAWIRSDETTTLSP